MPPARGSPQAPTPRLPSLGYQQVSSPNASPIGRGGTPEPLVPLIVTSRCSSDSCRDTTSEGRHSLRESARSASRRLPPKSHVVADRLVLK